jgi:hypothetical protein
LFEEFPRIGKYFKEAEMWMAGAQVRMDESDKDVEEMEGIIATLRAACAAEKPALGGGKTEREKAMMKVEIMISKNLWGCRGYIAECIRLGEQIPLRMVAETDRTLRLGTVKLLVGDLVHVGTVVADQLMGGEIVIDPMIFVSFKGQPSYVGGGQPKTLEGLGRGWKMCELAMDAIEAERFPNETNWGRSQFLEEFKRTRIAIEKFGDDNKPGELAVEENMVKRFCLAFADVMRKFAKEVYSVVSLLQERAVLCPEPQGKFYPIAELVPERALPMLDLAVLRGMLDTNGMLSLLMATDRGAGSKQAGAGTKKQPVAARGVVKPAGPPGGGGGASSSGGTPWTVRPPPSSSLPAQQPPRGATAAAGAPAAAAQPPAAFCPYTRARCHNRMAGKPCPLDHSYLAEGAARKDEQMRRQKGLPPLP